jgi:hypothetical protein
VHVRVDDAGGDDQIADVDQFGITLG